ncbi:MAG: glycosyltransferase family 4 protein [Flavobacteriaceae bacterium]|nr:glycosyltransferase family 4 protein [Flavobacteriaceae bacterium]
MKIKIAVIGLKGLPAYVGAGTVGENIIDQLKDKYDFYVYSTSSNTIHKSGFLNGYYQKVFRAIPNKKLNIFYYYLVSALHARYRATYDIIHVHNSFAGFTFGILKRKYPIVLTTHGAFNIVDKWKKFAWFFKYNTNKLVRKADYLCCVSKDEKRRFKKLLNLEAHYIPNGINPVVKNELPPIDISEPYIFFGSGRIIRTKGLHDLLQALHRLNFKGKLLVAGDMDQIPAYKAEILEMIGNLNVELVDLIKYKKLLFSYIANSQLFIFPSHIEGMSMMLLEAVAVDCPVICSDIIANKDILNETEALFFETGNYVDLAEKIKWAISNEDSMKERAENAKRKFLLEYNWKSIALQYEEIFEGMVQNKNRTRSNLVTGSSH